MSPFPYTFGFSVCREAGPGSRWLTELTGQAVGLISPLFDCLIVLLFDCFGACLLLLLHSFVAKQACLVLWLSQPAFLTDH